MKHFVTLLVISACVLAALGDVKVDRSQDWLQNAKRDKDVLLTKAIETAIAYVRAHGDNVDAKSKIRAHDVVLRAKPGHQGWDVVMDVDGKQECKVSLGKKEKEAEIKVETLSGCGSDCNNRKISCRTIG